MPLAIELFAPSDICVERQLWFEESPFGFQFQKTPSTTAAVDSYEGANSLAMSIVRRSKIGNFIHQDEFGFSLDSDYKPLFWKFMKSPGMDSYLSRTGSGASAEVRGLKLLKFAHNYIYEEDSLFGKRKPQKALMRHLKGRLLRGGVKLSDMEKIVLDVIFELGREEGSRILAWYRKIAQRVAVMAGLKSVHQQTIGRILERLGSLFPEIIVHTGKVWKRGQKRIATIIELDLCQDDVPENPLNLSEMKNLERNRVREAEEAPARALWEMEYDRLCLEWGVTC